MYAIDAGTLFLSGRGRMCVTTLGPFLQRVRSLVEGHALHTACLDLEAATYLDSTIMGNLVGIHKLLPNGLFLRHTSIEARQALEVMGLTRLLPPWPEERPFTTATKTLEANPDVQPQDLLDAHTLLSELSNDNARRFAGLRDILQEEIRRQNRG